MAKKKGITIGKTRSALYKTARTLGDVNAVTRGTVPQRVVSRGLGSIAAGIIGGIVRFLFGGKR